MATKQQIAANRRKGGLTPRVPPGRVPLSASERGQPRGSGVGVRPPQPDADRLSW